MGLFDKVVDVASEVADHVKQGAEVVREVAENLGLDKIANVAKNVSKFAGKLAIAPTPILEGGQKLIEKMRESAGGDNEPERAELFATASGIFKAQKDTLAEAHPGPDWDGGTASKAYDERTGEQENRVVTLADADSAIATIVGEEAVQLLKLREVLDRQHQWLADFASYSQWLGALGPEGKAAQFAAETWAVGMAMDICVPKTLQMYNDAKDNAALVRQAVDVYKQVASKATVSDSLNDFDPPKPPRR